MKEPNNKSGNKEFWGCIGAVGAALILGIVTIVVALPTLIPFFRSSPTPTFVNEVTPVLPKNESTIQATSVSTSQTFNFGGQCDSVPINLQDNLEVQLDASRWYLIEEYDNQANPPTHIFRSQIGTISVNANAVRGLRAWECRGESEAFSQAQLNAIGYKQNNPSHKVIGPDGQEVK